MFKSKVGAASLAESVTISARLSYVLRDWTSFAWSQEPPDLEFLMGEVGVAELGTLPFGATFDPVRYVHNQNRLSSIQSLKLGFSSVQTWI